MKQEQNFIEKVSYRLAENFCTTCGAKLHEIPLASTNQFGMTAMIKKFSN